MSLDIRSASKLRAVFSHSHQGAVAAGEPTYTFTFDAPTGLIIDYIEASAATADGTDGFTARLKDGATVLYEVAVATSGDPQKDEGVATNQSDIIAEARTLTVELDFSGATASENVISPYVVVWAHLKPRG